MSARPGSPRGGWNASSSSREVHVPLDRVRPVDSFGRALRVLGVRRDLIWSHRAIARCARDHPGPRMVCRHTPPARPAPDREGKTRMPFRRRVMAGLIVTALAGTLLAVPGERGEASTRCEGTFLRSDTQQGECRGLARAQGVPGLHLHVDGELEEDDHRLRSVRHALPDNPPDGPATSGGNPPCSRRIRSPGATSGSRRQPARPRRVSISRRRVTAPNSRSISRSIASRPGVRPPLVPDVASGTASTATTSWHSRYRRASR